MNFSTDQQDIIETFLRDNLPHGSGIDCKWNIEWLKNGKVKCSNAFHCMNENGYYCGYQDFTCIFNPCDSIEDFVLQFNFDQYLARKHMLRDYLEETVYYSFGDNRKKTLADAAGVLKNV